MAISSRLASYAGSAKNLAGCVGGLIGLGLHFGGVAGPYWPLVVSGLYGAGALVAPPEKVSLVIDDTAAETGLLRADLDGLVAGVREHRPPDEAVAHSAPSSASSPSPCPGPPATSTAPRPGGCGTTLSICASGTAAAIWSRPPPDAPSMTGLAGRITTATSRAAAVETLGGQGVAAR